MPLGMYETAEWCNSFVLVSKPIGKVRLCLNPVRLNQALIRLVHRGPTLYDIFPKLDNARYHNQKLDNRSLKLTTFEFQFGRYTYKRLPFGAAPRGDMFKRKKDEIF